MPSSASVEVTRRVDAPHHIVYEIIADYRQHHPRILPEPQFTSLHVEEGGVGAGTLVRVGMRMGGRSRTLRMRIEEPEPGRVLQEIDLDTGDVTTFTVEPEGTGSRVTIATTWQRKPGLEGWLERMFAPRMARALYGRELENLQGYAKKRAPRAAPSPAPGEIDGAADAGM